MLKKLRETFGLGEKVPQSMELKKFAYYLVDNQDINDSLFHAVDQRALINGLSPSDVVGPDRDVLVRHAETLEHIVEKSGVSLPEGVTAVTFAVEIVNRKRNGAKYVPVWLQNEQDIQQAEEVFGNVAIASLEDLRDLVQKHEVVSGLFQKLQAEEITVEDFAQKVESGSYALGENFIELTETLLHERPEEKEAA